MRVYCFILYLFFEINRPELCLLQHYLQQQRQEIGQDAQKQINGVGHVYIHRGVLFSHKETKKESVICSKVGGTRSYCVKKNTDPERQVLHVLSHMWKPKNKKVDLKIAS